MHREPKFRWMRNRSSHYLQEKEGCLGRLISSIKCLNPLLPPFPTTSATLQSVSPKVQLPKTWDPKRILTRSTFDSSVQLDGQGDLSNILTASCRLSRQYWKWRADGQLHLLAEVMTGQPQAPTKSLEMGLYGHVTNIFTNPSELIHPNGCCSQGDHLKRNYNCSSPQNHLEIQR